MSSQFNLINMCIGYGRLLELINNNAKFPEQFEDLMPELLRLIRKEYKNE